MKRNHPVQYNLMLRCRKSPGQCSVSVTPICHPEICPYIAVWLRISTCCASHWFASQVDHQYESSIEFQSDRFGFEEEGCERAINIVRGNLDAVEADKEPYEGGIVHQVQRNRNKHLSPFKELYARDTQLKEFEQEFSRRDLAVQQAENKAAAPGEQ